jgi:Family of unknown function (DUF6152)
MSQFTGPCRRGSFVASAAFGAAIIAAGPAAAHHSFAMFDKEHPVTLEGTVKAWEFTNPHTWLIIVATKDGVPTEYDIEGSSVNTLVRQGMGLHSFVPGEKIMIVISPLKNGGNGGAFVKATKADGTVLTESPTPN